MIKYLLSTKTQQFLLPNLSQNELENQLARNRAQVGMTLNKAGELIRILKGLGHNDSEIAMIEKTVYDYVTILSDEKVNQFLAGYNSQRKNGSINPLPELTFYYLKQIGRIHSDEKKRI